LTAATRIPGVAEAELRGGAAHNKTTAECRCVTRQFLPALQFLGGRSGVGRVYRGHRSWVPDYNPAARGPDEENAMMRTAAVAGLFLAAVIVGSAGAAPFDDAMNALVRDDYAKAMRLL